MSDPRDRQLAELLVDTCVGVQPGWQVLVVGTPLGRPLLEEIVRVVAERDAYALLRLTFGGSSLTPRTWLPPRPWSGSRARGARRARASRHATR